MKWRLWVLVGAVLAAVLITFCLPPIPQSEAYHNFTDQRALLGIPHCLDVLSNVFFLLVGLLGIRFVLRNRNENGPAFLRPLERWPYLAFFVAVALTAFGSAYYHLHPDDHRLVWDRIPITLSVMSLLAATFGERVCIRTASWLLAPLLLLGAFSAIYWEKTQAAGHGDLRPYALAQFGSLLILLLLVALFPPRYTRGADLLVSLAIYAVAKLFEAADRPIFSLGQIVSGHTLKHLAAALSAYWILRMLRLRTPIVARATVSE
jgi:hypothetical protein